MASKRCERRRNCQKKVHHATVEHAALALANCGAEGLHYYKCPHCGRGYVLGHRIGYCQSVNKYHAKKG